MATVDQIRNAKAVAKRTLGDIPGVAGIGIGNGVLRVYVQDASVIDRLPRSCEEVDIEFVVAGEIKAFDPPAPPTDDGRN